MTMPASNGRRRWPRSRRSILNLKQGAEDTDAACEQLYRELSAKGVEVLYDDTDQRAGAKFAAADLIGIPWQILVGPKGLAEGKLELKRRSDGSRENSEPGGCRGAADRVTNYPPRALRISRRRGHNWPESCENRTMDEAMSEPVRTPPFAPFEWLLSGRYLRARRKEGFISVIAGFSFLGIMLGVATLIIVMAVMNGFRKELLDKILGLNGHLLVQPLESPLTDWKDVAERIIAGRGHPARRPRRGRPGAGHPRRSTPPAFSFAASAPTISTTSPRSPRTSSRARSRASTRGRASPSAAGSPISCRCMPATASRWWRRRAR